MGNTITGSTPSKLNPEYIGSDIPFLSPGDISLLNKIISYDSQGLSLLGKSVARPVPPQTILQVCIGGSIGKCAVVDREVCFNQQINSITLEEIDYKYVYEVLQSKIFQDLMKSKSTGTATPIINKGAWDLLIFPLPPLAEQKRIVAKLEQVLPLAEEYGAAQEQLDKLNKELPEALKKSILQEAIQGKLVPQNPKDEPAQKLLEKIANSRHSERCEESGKRSKNASKDQFSRIYRENGVWYEQVGSAAPKDISDEIPFEIPETWAWCRMGNIGSWGAGATPAKGNPAFYKNGEIPWLVTGELNNSVVTETKTKISKVALEKCSLRLCKPGDVLIAMYGATIGKLAIAGIELTTNQACCACTPHYEYNKYLFYFLMASKPDLIKRGEGGAQPNISKEKLINYLMPLPPLAEQKRIVAKLEQLFKVL
jgi:type I restriction enzyme S subunit